VPSSSDRMLEKSLNIKSDVIIYDLEDSVSPADKIGARHRLQGFLQVIVFLPLSHFRKTVVPVGYG
jgi:citrate lyase beta subunit